MLDRQQMCSIFAILLVLHVSALAAEAEPRLRHIGIAEGLAQSSVHALLQDSRGFIWIGTNYGLHRYDGYRFEIFQHSPGDNASLSNSRIQSLLEDRRGNLWVGTGDGLNRMQLQGKAEIARESGRFKRLQPAQNSSASQRYVRALAEDSSGRVWIGTAAGLFSWDDSGNSDSIRQIEPDATDLTGSIYTLYAGKDGELWAGVRGGLLHLTPAGTTLPAVAISIRSSEINPVYRITPGNMGMLWLGTPQGLFRFDPLQGTGLHIDTGDEPGTNELITKIVQDSDGTLWLGTPSGIKHIDPQNGLLARYQYEVDNPGSLSAEYVWDILLERGGDVWIATSPGGVNILKRGKQPFELIDEVPGGSNSLNDNFVFSLYEDNRQDLWIGTWTGGLNQMTGQDGQRVFYHHKHDPENPYSLSGNTVYAICGDHSEVDAGANLWIGTDGGLSRQRNGSGIFETVDFRRDELSGEFPQIYALAVDKEKAVWVGTTGGLVKLPAGATGPALLFHAGDRESEGLVSSEVNVIHIDKSGDAWIGTSGGISRINTESGRITNYYPDADDPNALPARPISAIFSDPRHLERIWVGSEGSGLMQLDKATGRVQQISPSHLSGVSFNRQQMIRALLIDQAGFIWMSSLHGISRFDPEAGQFRYFSPDDGLQGWEFSASAAAAGPTGNLYFGGINGLNRILPEAVAAAGEPPPVYITAFTLGYQSPEFFSERLGSSGDEPEIVLAHDENVFSVAFTALDFRQPDENHYAYMLEGFDGTWVACGTRSQAYYTNMSPGSYRFRVRAGNADDIWNLAGASIRIIIRPPFWKTAWFMLLTVLAIGALLLILHRWRVNQRLRRIHDIEAVRRQAAADFHDELGHKLTQISLVSEIASRNVPDSHPDLGRSLQTIRDASRTLYDQTRDFIWSLDPGRDNLAALGIYLKDFADELFANSDIAFRTRFNVAETEKISLSMSERRHIILIFKEAMHNVLKHSGAGSVELNMDKTSGRVQIQLMDDGVGISERDRVQRVDQMGNGIRNMFERANQTSGKLQIISNPGEGTRLIFSLAEIR